MRLGVLDVGSNTVHLQIMDAHHGSAPTAQSSFKEEIRLTQYLDQMGSISEEGLKLLISAIKSVYKQASKIELDETLAFATSAIREASNSDDVLGKVRVSTGIEFGSFVGL